MNDHVLIEDKFINRFLWEVLPDGSWNGKECFIIGGGPSLRSFDWTLLKNKLTIGINITYTRFDPTIIFSMDPHLIRWINEAQYGPEAIELFNSSTALKAWLCTQYCKLPEEILILRVWENYTAGFRAFPRSMKEGIGHGNNSGYAALNLAVCLGANPIYLLGFDMNFKGSETHWHQGHPKPQNIDRLRGFIEYFRTAAEKCQEWGIRVINLNPSSALPYFEKQDYRDVLK